MLRTPQANRSLRSLFLVALALPCVAATAKQEPTVAKESTNLIPNGDFVQGNVGFTSDLPYVKPSYNCLWEGKYTIATNFNTPQLHSLIAPEAFIAPIRPTTKEKVMYVNAGSPEAVTLWSAKVACKAHTKYLLSFNCMSLTGYMVDGNPPHQVATPEWAADFEITANQDSSIPVESGCARFHKGSFIWDSKEATTAVVSVIRDKFPHGGGLYALANISMTPVK